MTRNDLMPKYPCRNCACIVAYTRRGGRNCLSDLHYYHRESDKYGGHYHIRTHCDAHHCDHPMPAGHGLRKLED